MLLGLELGNFSFSAMFIDDFVGQINGFTKVYCTIPLWPNLFAGRTYIIYTNKGA